MADIVELISPLARNECVARLRAAVDSPWSFAGSRPVVGTVGEAKFKLHKRVGYRNSFQVFATASLMPEGRRCRIACRFAISRFVTAFFTIWLVGVGMAISLAVLHSMGFPPASPSTRDSGGGAIAVVLGGLLMLTFAGGMALLGRYLARGERAFLLDFIAKTLDAAPAKT